MAMSRCEVMAEAINEGLLKYGMQSHLHDRFASSILDYVLEGAEVDAGNEPELKVPVENVLLYIDEPDNFANYTAEVIVGKHGFSVELHNIHAEDAATGTVNLCQVMWV